jgi:hypothetical protein
MSRSGSAASRLPVATLTALLALSACSSSKTDTTSDGGRSDAHSDARTKDAKPAPVDASDAAPEIADPMAPPLLTLDCDPMVPTQCGFPFPSSVWTTPDPSTATGVHLYFGPTTLPETQSNTPVRMSVTPFLTHDGFAQGSVILTHRPNATATGLPNQDNIALSIATSSPTILMEADTGVLVPQFSELDQRSQVDAQRAFMIEPQVRLKDATRYLVAIRHVVDDHGKELPVNPVFQALRDDTPSKDLSVPPRRTLYADIISKLSAHGVETSTLQLAWDFTTASQANTTQWLTHMRDDALAVVGDKGPSYVIDSVTMNPNSYIYERLAGTMTVPYYLTGKNTDADGGPSIPASINLGPDGLPVQNGTANFPFLVHIPNSLVTSKKKGPIIINAHGLLGDESEGEDGYLAEICNREGYVGVAVDLVGMDSSDITFIALALGTDPSGFEQAIEMQHQGLVNELLAVRMMMGGLATDPATAPNGNPTIDPTQRFYRGDSQGGIFGSTFMAISTDVTRGLLGEPGAPYSLLLNRSVDFGEFFYVLNQAYASQLQIQLGIDLIDQLWFRTEPGGYIGYVRDNLLENTPSHDVIIHAGLGDGEVTTLGAELIARTIGAKNLSPVNHEIYGVTDSPSGFTGSGIVEWNFGLPPIPLIDVPPDAGPDPHGELRYVPAAQDMADKFFRTGQIVETCPNGGPCRVYCTDAGDQSCTTTP